MNANEVWCCLCLWRTSSLSCTNPVTVYYFQTFLKLHSCVNFLVVLYKIAITQPRAYTCDIDCVKLCLLSLSWCVQHWLWLHSAKIGLAVILDLHSITAESSCINPVTMYCIQTYPKRPSCVNFLGVLYKNAITQLSLHMQFWFCPCSRAILLSWCVQHLLCLCSNIIGLAVILDLYITTAELSWISRIPWSASPL